MQHGTNHRHTDSHTHTNDGGGHLVVVVTQNPQQQPLLPRAQLEGKDGSSSPRRRHQEVMMMVMVKVKGQAITSDYLSVTFRWLQRRH